MEEIPLQTQVMAGAAMKKFLATGDRGCYDFYQRLTEDDQTFEANMLLDGKSCDDYHADDGFEQYTESDQSFVHSDNKEEQGLVF